LIFFRFSDFSLSFGRGLPSDPQHLGFVAFSLTRFLISCNQCLTAFSGPQHS